MLLRRAAAAVAGTLLADLDAVVAAAPWRHMTTPNGLRMSVAMSNCGELGWVGDRRGCRYERIDPLGGSRWPAMPAWLAGLAGTAASAAVFDGFEPDAC